MTTFHIIKLFILNSQIGPVKNGSSWISECTEITLKSSATKSPGSGRHSSKSSGIRLDHPGNQLECYKITTERSIIFENYMTKKPKPYVHGSILRITDDQEDTLEEVVCKKENNVPMQDAEGTLINLFATGRAVSLIIRESNI